MKTYLVVWLFGQVAAVVGPWPTPVEACREYAASEASRWGGLDFSALPPIGDRSVLRSDVRIDCIETAARPVIAEDWDGR